MTMNRIGRLAALGAVLGLVAACADTPAPLAPSLDVSAAVVAEGELTICKVGNVAGTFDFTWTITRTADGSTYDAGNVQLAAGACAMVKKIPSSPSVNLRAAVTEGALPTDWSLTSIGHAYSAPISIVPVVNLGTQTISNVGLSHDVGATITFTNTYTPPPPPPTGCTYTQGYWKTHSEFGPAPYDATWAQLSNGASTVFYLSGQTWYQVFHTAPAGNAYYSLAHQFMAAKLSILAGASSSAVAATLAAAETLFNTYTPAQIGALKGSNAIRQQFNALAEVLDSYNNGLIGPGHCD